MTDKNIFQLVQKQNDPAKTPEFLERVEGLIREIREDDVSYIIIVGRDEANEIGFITNLDLPSSNLMLDQVKLTGILQNQ